MQKFDKPLELHVSFLTKVMVFKHPRRNRSEVKIRVDSVALQQVNVFKYLGFLVTPGLHFSAHVTQVKERARAAAYVTSQLVSKLQIFDFLRLWVYFQCYVESQFYGMELLPGSAIDALC